jgi:hypothetical protein
MATPPRSVDVTVSNTEIEATTVADIWPMRLVHTATIHKPRKLLRCTRILRIKHIGATKGWLKRVPDDPANVDSSDL